MMKRCPECGFRVKENIRDCPLCGVRMHLVPDGQTNNYVTHVHSENERCMLPNKNQEAAVQWRREQKVPQPKRNVNTEETRKQVKPPVRKTDTKRSADMGKFWVGLVVLLFFWLLESCTF